MDWLFDKMDRLFEKMNWLFRYPRRVRTLTLGVATFACVVAVIQTEPNWPVFICMAFVGFVQILELRAAIVAEVRDE